MNQRELDRMLQAHPHSVLASLLEITIQALDRLEQQTRDLLVQKRALAKVKAKASMPPWVISSRGGPKP